jgi:plasmid stability protein
MGSMKTTLELPDELMREIKVVAAMNDQKLKDVMADLLHKGLAAQEVDEEQHEAVWSKVELPLVKTLPVKEIKASDMDVDAFCAWVKQQSRK